MRRNNVNKPAPAYLGQGHIPPFKCAPAQTQIFICLFLTDLCAETDREQYLSETKEKAICRSSFLIRYAPEVQAGNQPSTRRAS